jgi:hypothetical protein
MLHTILLALCVAASAETQDPAAPLPEAGTLLEGLVERQRRFEAVLNDYTYDLETVTEKLDKAGGVASRESKQYEVFFVKGKRVRRQVGEDGRPLSAERQAKVDKDVQKYVDDVLAGKARPPRHSGTELSDILDRYEFRTVAREMVGGRSTIVMEFAARPGNRDLEGDFALRQLAGRVWMDEQDKAVVRAEVRSTGRIKVALGLGASISSVFVTSDFVKVEDGVWLPSRIQSQVDGRILLVKGIRERNTGTFTRYRRFTTESTERPTLPPH